MSDKLPPCPEDDPNVGSGVLTSDEIKYCITKFKLIEPFDEEKDDKKLKPARFKLSLGENYAMAGDIKKLYDEPGKNEFVIPPFQVAIVSTKEILNMPRFLIGRWNLDIDLVYKGLLWVGGPQVDPGYYGHLYCPLYNLSSDPVKLTLGQDIATIDFVRTTPFKKGVSKPYPRPPRRRELCEYEYKWQSALYELASKKIQVFGEELESFKEKIEETSEKTSERVYRSIVSIFTVLAILIAVISLIISNQNWTPIPMWGLLALGFSVYAFIFVLAPSVKSIKKWLKDP